MQFAWKSHTCLHKTLPEICLQFACNLLAVCLQFTCHCLQLLAIAYNCLQFACNLLAIYPVMNKSGAFNACNLHAIYLQLHAILHAIYPANTWNLHAVFFLWFACNFAHWLKISWEIHRAFKSNSWSYFHHLFFFISSWKDLAFFAKINILPVWIAICVEFMESIHTWRQNL